jgi:hypothetical protein
MPLTEEQRELNRAKQKAFRERHADDQTNAQKVAWTLVRYAGHERRHKEISMRLFDPDHQIRMIGEALREMLDDDDTRALMKVLRASLKGPKSQPKRGSR